MASPTGINLHRTIVGECRKIADSERLLFAEATSRARSNYRTIMHWRLLEDSQESPSIQP
jgi:hypothetical protein